MFVSDEQVLSIFRDETYFCRPAGKTFLAKMVEYGMERTDAPAVYHLAMALSLLSGAATKEYGIENFGGILRPNLYIMIIGASAARKTQAASIAFKSIFSQALPDRVGILPGSYEGLIDGLAVKPQQVVVDTDMTRFYEQAKGTGHLGPLKQGLTDIYDCESLSRQTRKVRISIPDGPRLTFVGCIALDHFEGSVEVKDITGGYLSRFLLAIGARERLLLPQGNPVYTHQPMELAQHLRWISSVCPRSLGTMTPEANALLGEINQSWDTVQQGVDQKSWSSVWGRAAAMVRKLALLLALDRHSRDSRLPMEPSIDGFPVVATAAAQNLPDVVITVEDIKKAHEIASLFVQSSCALIERLPFTQQAREIQSVRRAVESAGLEAHRKNVPGATLGAVSRTAGLNLKTTRHMLETLMEQGVITATPVRGAILYNLRPVREGVDPSWETFLGGFDPENPPQVQELTLPANVFQFPDQTAPKPPEPEPKPEPKRALSYAEAKALGVVDDEE